MQRNQLWIELAARAEITLSDEQHSRLSRYLELLFEANARMNLTRITDRSAAEVQHIADALTLLPHLPHGSVRIADIGSGGGVPGIPLAIACPGATVVLIESTKKKAAFLTSTAEALGLTNVAVFDSRAEDLGHGELRETFDVAIARAVATMDWLAEWCLPLVRTGGKVLAMKGPRVTDELPAAAKPIKLLGGGVPVVHPVHLPTTEHRVIVEIPKLGKTDARYPRPATAAKGMPLA